MAVILTEEETAEVKSVMVLCQNATNGTGKYFEVSGHGDNMQLDIDGDGFAAGNADDMKRAVKLIYKAVTGSEIEPVSDAGSEDISFVRDYAEYLIKNVNDDLYGNYALWTDDEHRDMESKISDLQEILDNFEKNPNPNVIKTVSYLTERYYKN